MLKAVSWKAFLIALVVLVIVYYLVILLKYFRKEINSFLSGKREGQYKSKEKAENKFKERPITETSWDELEMVVHDLRYGVMERFGAGADKEMLLNALKQRLQSYQGLKKAAFHLAINNYIITNAKEINGVIYSAEELDDAWDSMTR